MQGQLFDVPAPTVERPAPSGRQVSDPVLELLRAATIQGCTLLPMPPAERSVYEEFDEILRRLRGRWVRGKGHVFPYDPTAAIRAVIDSGRAPAKNPLAYFPTPRAVAENMVELASNYGYGPQLRVLEPSAGSGALITAVLSAWSVDHVTALELDPLNVAVLRAEAWPANELTPDRTIDVIEGDFLTHDFGTETFDVVLMNPPFNGEEWIKHIKRAWSLLADVGILVSVIPLGTWRTSSAPRHVELREWMLSVGAGLLEHEPGTFEDAGTNVATATLVLQRYPERFWLERHQDYPSLPAFHCWTLCESTREWAERYASLRHLPADSPEARAFLRELATETNAIEQGGVPVCLRLLDQLARDW